MNTVQSELGVKQDRLSPQVDRDFRGVRIGLDTAGRRSGLDEPLWLYGTIQLDTKQAEELQVVPVQRAVVLTVNSQLVAQSWNVAGNAVLFPDDQQVGSGLVRAYFKTNISARFQTTPGHNAYLVASIGPWVSNVVSWNGTT